MMSSLLRILFGVLAVIAVFVGIGVLDRWFPNFIQHAFYLGMGCDLPATISRSQSSHDLTFFPSLLLVLYRVCFLEWATTMKYGSI
jgi:hypothetical protein